MRAKINGTTVNITADQMDRVTTLQAAHHGFAAIMGYVSTTGRVTPETANYVIQSKFSTQRVRDNNVAALREITVDDLDLTDWVPNKGKNACDTAEEQFELCVKLLLDSIEKTNSGDRSDAHRQGHDCNYLRVCSGVKIHYVTDFVKNEEGKSVKRPVLDKDGVPTVKSIMVEGLVHDRKVVTKGEYKKVNSGSKVLMDNAIKRVWNRRRNNLVTFVLTDDKFESVKIGGEWIESVAGKVLAAED